MKTVGFIVQVKTATLLITPQFCQASVFYGNSQVILKDLLIEINCLHEIF